MIVNSIFVNLKLNFTIREWEGNVILLKTCSITKYPKQYHKYCTGSMYCKIVKEINLLLEVRSILYRLVAFVYLYTVRGLPTHT